MAHPNPFRNKETEGSPLSWKQLPKKVLHKKASRVILFSRLTKRKKNSNGMLNCTETKKRSCLSKKKWRNSSVGANISYQSLNWTSLLGRNLSLARLISNSEGLPKNVNRKRWWSWSSTKSMSRLNLRCNRSLKRSNSKYQQLKFHNKQKRLSGKSSIFPAVWMKNMGNQR